MDRQRSSDFSSEMPTPGMCQAKARILELNLGFHTEGKDTTSWAITCCFRRRALAVKWKSEVEPGLKPDTLIGGVGVSDIFLTAVPNAHPWDSYSFPQNNRYNLYS